MGGHQFLRNELSNQPHSYQSVPRKKQSCPKKGEGRGSSRCGDVPPWLASTRSASPLPPMGFAPVLTCWMQTFLTRQLPACFYCPSFMLSSDPVNCGANATKWIRKNTENLPSQNLYVKDNCLLVANHHQNELIYGILKEEIDVTASERAPAPTRVALLPRKIGQLNHAATKPAPHLPSLANSSMVETVSCVEINRGASGPVIGWLS